jgi:hypothetical protein
MIVQCTEFYTDVIDWIRLNENNTYYLYASQQSDNLFDTFCKAVLSEGGIPIIMTNVGAFDRAYPPNLRLALDNSDDVRVYEVAKMGMTVVLQAKARLFIETNGGILWTP